MMVIALGGMQGIPHELYEAARIDRASRWQQFWHITLPLLKPVLLPAMTLGTIWTFNNLNVIWLVSNGGEPQDSTHILVSYVYKAVFNLYRYGYGAALSMVIFFMLAGVFDLVFEADAGDRKRVRLERTAIDARIKMDHRRCGTRCCCCLSRSRFIRRSTCCRFRCGPAIGCGRPTWRSFRTTGRSTATCSCSPNSRFCDGWAIRSIVAAGVTVTGVALAAIGGYAFSRFRFVGRNATMLAILTTQMFPATMLLLPLYLVIAKLHLVNTYLGLMVFYTSTALPFCVWQMKGFYDTIPASLEEAARIDGCSRGVAFWRVILPLAVPGLVITALFSFMAAWSEYIVAAQVMQDEEMFTLPLGLKSFQSSLSTQWGLYAAASILVSLPVVIVFLMLSKFLVSGLTLGSVKE